MIGLRVLVVLGPCFLLCPAPTLAQEQPAEQPAPLPVPVAPVDLSDLGPMPPVEFSGSGRAIDGDEIAIGEVVFRLEGIAAPDMTAPEGPEARVALSALIEGQRLACKVLDRGTDPNDLSGYCLVNGDDVAETLLAQGLVAVHRLGGKNLADSAARDREARYDAAENEARQRKIGLWMVAESEPPAPVVEPAFIDPAIRNAWLAQAPILFLAALALAGAALAFSTSRRDRANRRAAENRALSAVLLAEVLAIRASAAAALDGTANLIQDLPIPNAQMAMISLPAAGAFPANAHRLTRLPRSISVDLTQFQIRHEATRAILAQGAHLRCDQLRASLTALVQTADEIIQRADAYLD
jgi:endonuclease YncB( thermonuclease family)